MLSRLFAHLCQVQACRDSIPVDARDGIPQGRDSIPARRDSIPAGRDGVPGRRDGILSALKKCIYFMEL